MAKLFEVKVEVSGFEYYEIEARDADDALNKFTDGVLTGTEQLTSSVVSVTAQFEDDDWDGGYASGD